MIGRIVAQQDGHALHVQIREARVQAVHIGLVAHLQGQTEYLFRRPASPGLPHLFRHPQGGTIRAGHAAQLLPETLIQVGHTGYKLFHRAGHPRGDIAPEQFLLILAVQQGLQQFLLVDARLALGADIAEPVRAQENAAQAFMLGKELAGKTLPLLPRAAFLGNAHGLQSLHGGGGFHGLGLDARRFGLPAGPVHGPARVFKVTDKLVHVLKLGQGQLAIGQGIPVACRAAVRERRGLIQQPFREGISQDILSLGLGLGAVAFHNQVGVRIQGVDDLAQAQGFRGAVPLAFRHPGKRKTLHDPAQTFTGQGINLVRLDGGRLSCPARYRLDLLAGLHGLDIQLIGQPGGVQKFQGFHQIALAQCLLQAALALTQGGIVCVRADVAHAAPADLLLGLKDQNLAGRGQTVGQPLHAFRGGGALLGQQLSQGFIQSVQIIAVGIPGHLVHGLFPQGIVTGQHGLGHVLNLSPLALSLQGETVIQRIPKRVRVLPAHFLDRQIKRQTVFPHKPASGPGQFAHRLLAVFPFKGLPVQSRPGLAAEIVHGFPELFLAYRRSGDVAVFMQALLPVAQGGFVHGNHGIFRRLGQPGVQFGLILQGQFSVDPGGPVQKVHTLTGA